MKSLSLSFFVRRKVISVQTYFSEQLMKTLYIFHDKTFQILSFTASETFIMLN